jgi:hypothetical protein
MLTRQRAKQENGSTMTQPTLEEVGSPFKKRTREDTSNIVAPTEETPPVTPTKKSKTSTKSPKKRKQKEEQVSTLDSFFGSNKKIDTEEKENQQESNNIPNNVPQNLPAEPDSSESTKGFA